MADVVQGQVQVDLQVLQLLRYFSFPALLLRKCIYFYQCCCLSQHKLHEKSQMTKERKKVSYLFGRTCVVLIWRDGTFGLSFMKAFFYRSIYRDEPDFFV